MDARLGPLALAGLLVLAGCAGGLPGDDGASAEDAPPTGTQFVSVDRYENRSRHAQWPDRQTVVFEDLSESRQQVFEKALSGGSVEVAPDESNPFSFHDDDRPRAVRYDGTWYYVRVAIV
ncbi:MULTISPECIES: hypothetical protein [Halorussus]|uniref:hypothetical protein n=1 Tax=Halorussus TaxID=1070314 RepID=UPI000E216CE1|nr:MULTISPECIES: hypothetical protein [Halorussus]NHN57502.1 hypothetical protein [Halorussus sp. JP-T4]